MQPLLCCQLAGMRGHGLDRQDEEQRRQRAALEDPRLDWEACCVPAVEGSRAVVPACRRLTHRCAPAHNPTAAMPRSIQGLSSLSKAFSKSRKRRTPGCWLCWWKSMVSRWAKMLSPIHRCGRKPVCVLSTTWFSSGPNLLAMTRAASL